MRGKFFAKLTVGVVEAIQRELKFGHGQYPRKKQIDFLARRFRVSVGTIRAIDDGKIYVRSRREKAA